MTITLLQGDACEMLQTLADRSVQTIVNSPPYYGLRKYTSDPREIGHEPTPAAFVAALVAVYHEARRVLRDDGTLWIVIGDSYANDSKWGGASGAKNSNSASMPREREYIGLPDKNLIGIPWRLAFALQDDGWILRQEIIWSKPNGMPESVTDRPTRAHETVFLLSKRARYFYDAAAIAERSTGQTGAAANFKRTTKDHAIPNQSVAQHRLDRPDTTDTGTRNARSVWNIATQPLSDAHYAPMPEALARRCILAGSAAQACETCGAPWARVVERESNWQERKAAGGTAGNVGTSDTYQNGVHGKGMSHDLGSTSIRDLGFAPTCACHANTGSAASVVLDPFMGSGTVARVAEKLQRNAIGIDLAYQELQEKRTDGVQRELFV